MWKKNIAFKLHLQRLRRHCTISSAIKTISKVGNSIVTEMVLAQKIANACKIVSLFPTGVALQERGAARSTDSEILMKLWHMRGARKTGRDAV